MARNQPAPKHKSIAKLSKLYESGDKTARSELVELARTGDESALEALKRIDHKDPGWRSLIGVAAEDVVIRHVCRGFDPYTTWLIERDQMRIRTALAMDGDSPLELALIEQIAILMLVVSDAEARALATDAPIAHLEFRLKKADRARRQLVSAMKNLAVIRRLRVNGPAVQVNVTQQMLNVNGGQVLDENLDSAARPGTSQVIEGQLPKP